MIIYSKLNNYRKSKYRLVTTIEEEDGKKFVRKRAMTSDAEPFLRSYMDKFSLINEHSKIEVVKPSFVDNSVIYDYIDGETFLWQIEKSMRNGEEENVIKLIENYRALEIFPSVKKELSAEFKNVFGDSLDNEESWTYPGVLDLNLDNIIEDSTGKLYLFDYEWTWDAALPTNFIFFRSISNLLFSLKSKGINISYYYKYYKEFFKEEYIRAEYSFQKSISNLDKTYDKYREEYFQYIKNSQDRQYYLDYLAAESTKLRSDIIYYQGEINQYKADAQRYQKEIDKLSIKLIPYQKVFENKYTYKIVHIVYRFLKMILNK